MSGRAMPGVLPKSASWLVARQCGRSILCAAVVGIAALACTDDQDRGSTADKAGAPSEGTVQVVVPYDIGGPRAVHVDSKSVYWGAGRQIKRMSKKGGPVEELGPYSGRATSLHVIQTDTENVYWLDRDGIHVRSHDGSVSRILPTGGMDIIYGGEYLVAEGRVIFAAPACLVIGVMNIDGSGYTEVRAMDTSDPGGATELTADAEYIYCSRPDLVVRVKLAEPTQMEALAAEQHSIGAFTSNGTDLFWTTSLPSSTLPMELMRLSKQGGAPELLSTTEPAHPGVLHFDSQRRTLFWNTGISFYSAVYAYSLDDNAVVKLVDDRETNGGLAGDDEYLYWTEHQGIVRMRKPD